MTFSLSGFDSWTFQVVFYGSVLVLEALRDYQRLSTVLNLIDDPHARAHELIRCPSCSLISR